MAENTIKRGYNWVMTARGFEVYTRQYNGHTFLVLSDGVAERMNVPQTQLECWDGDAYLTWVDEFWAENGR